jgi:hypothetical protein
VILLGGGCGHGTTLAPDGRRIVAEQYIGHRFEVRHTSVIGDLYDDNERELISPYPFDEVFHQVDLLGAPMHPGHPRALVPAGTAVQIEAISYPGPTSWTRRMLATPRDAIWLQLRLVPEHADREPLARPPLILPIVAGPLSVAAFDRAVGRYLAPVGDVSRWMLGRKPAIAVAIAHKEVLVGMSQEEMETALGPPWRWCADQLPDGTELKVAWYPKNEVWLSHGQVLAQKPSRLMLR